MADDGSISLNKFISDSGLCSRREADKLIKAGRVAINRMPTKPGNRVLPGDEVRVDGRIVKGKAAPIYIALHKPAGIVTTTDDRDKDNIIRHINYPERLFPIGRLDKLSEGLIFLTNNGDIVNKILRAGNNHEKEYIVTVDKPLTEKFIQNMRSGVQILGRTTKPCLVEKIVPRTFSIILTQGMNRQIRRMCTHLGYEVVKLKRVRIMHIKLDKLPEGDWREFTKDEVREMYRLIGDSKNDSASQRAPKKKFKPKRSFKPKEQDDKPSKYKQKSSRKPGKFTSSKSAASKGPRQGKSRVKPRRK